MKITIASRGSKLAVTQSEEVKARLEEYDSSLEVEIKIINTKGDMILDKPLNKIGEKGLFTKELEEQLLDGRVDLAVHSMKDMPSVLPKGLMFAGTLTPSDPHDCLVFNGDYKNIDELPIGATIGTGSPRRKYQLLQYRPDLNIVGIRGNVQTRLKKMKEEGMHATVLACAGLKRLGMEDLIGQSLSYDIMTPACAQGILALEVKENSWLLPILEGICDKTATKRMELERLYLETIGGSCHVPIGAHIDFIDNGIDFYCVYGDEEGHHIERYHEIICENYEERIKEIALMMKDKVISHG